MLKVQKADRSGKYSTWSDPSETNEVRADALDVKDFTKNCETSIDCKVSENKGTLVTELKKSILKKAAIYEKEYRKKNKKKYEYTEGTNRKKKKNN